MSDHWIQEQTRLRQRRKAKSKGMADGAPFIGFVTGGHDPASERVTVQWHAGERKLRTMHPYTGSDSWIRVGMEASQAVVLSQRPDSDEPELLAYSFRSPEDRISAYEEGAGLYRPITPGEVEIHSKGAAQTLYSRRPLLEQRGGLIRSWLDQDELQSGQKAPVHVRYLHLHKSDAIGDEERFGVAQRPDGSAWLTKFIKADRQPDVALGLTIGEVAATNSIIPELGPWAKEYVRILKTGALFPEKLIDHREGDVLDDEGNAINLSSTGNPLRYKAEYFTQSQLGGVVFFGIDDQGNMSAHFPEEAETGVDIIIPKGELIMQINKTWTTTIDEGDYLMTVVEGAMTIQNKADYSHTVEEGNHLTTVQAGQMDIIIEDNLFNLDVSTGDITINANDAPVHITSGGTEIHTEDGLIELGAEGAGDIAVLDSLLQDELSAIAETIAEVVDDLNLHKHPVPKFVVPLIPISEAPTIPPADAFSTPPGYQVTLDTESMAEYDPGDTASGLVTIDE